MVQTVAIVTDSVACLTRELVAQYGIGILPINFYLDGRTYKDWVDTVSYTHLTLPTTPYV